MSATPCCTFRWLIYSICEKVIRRIRREVAKKVVEDLDDDLEDEPPPSLDFDPKARLTAAFGGAARASRYVQNGDGTLLVVTARPVRQTTEVDFARKLLATVQRAITQVQPETFHPQMVVEVQGEYQERLSETTSIFGQVLATAIAATALLFVLIAGYFRQFRAVPTVLVPVLVAAIATLGLGGAIYGSLNLATAFIFAILLGLGIDFAIHVLARYSFEREARCRNTRTALRLALSSTGSALVAGAATTIAVFLSLQLGRFRGFSQFGMLAGIGVLLSLAATFVLVPALVVLVARCAPRRRFRRQTPRGAAVIRRSRLERRAAPRRPFVALVAIAGVAAAATSLWRSQQLSFEYDFNKLGRKPRTPTARAAGPDYRTATGKTTSFAPAVALCRDEQQCRRTTRLLQAIRLVDEDGLQRLRTGTATRDNVHLPTGETIDIDEDADAEDAVGDGPFAPLREELAGSRLLPEQRELLSRFSEERLRFMRRYLLGVLSLQAFIPERQQDKLRIIADIKSRLDRKRGAFPPADKEKLDRWYPYLAVSTPIVADKLPNWVSQQFIESNGTLGAFAVFFNGGSKRDYRHAKRLHDAYFNLPVGSERVAVAANYFVLAEAIDTLRADGPVVLGAAAVAVLVCLIIVFRSLRAALLVLIPLLSSVSWLLGLYLLFDVKLNIFNIIALPLLIGMAVDNGIHVYHRYAETRDFRLVLREVGGPITLTTVTTFVGFSSLLIADHVGIQSLGLAASLGMLLGLVGSVVLLPALMVTLGRHALPK